MRTTRPTARSSRSWASLSLGRARSIRRLISSAVGRVPSRIYRAELARARSDSSTRFLSLRAEFNNSLPLGVVSMDAWTPANQTPSFSLPGLAELQKNWKTEFEPGARGKHRSVQSGKLSWDEWRGISGLFGPAWLRVLYPSVCVLGEGAHLVSSWPSPFLLFAKRVPSPS